jgi:hypothetical protein
MADQTQAPADNPLGKTIVKWATNIGIALTGLQGVKLADAYGLGWVYVIALAVAGGFIGAVVGFAIGKIIAAIVAYMRAR